MVDRPLNPPAAEPALYGVLDLAMAPHLFDDVQRLAPFEARCLYDERIEPEVLRVAPHVVRLEQHDPLSQSWRTTGWGQAWGMLIVSAAPMAAVRRRLRHFTQARLPGGEGPVLFRFWDPRVFRIYMPLVEPDQLAGWFDGVDRYIVETEDGRGSLRYRLGGDGRLLVEEGPRPGA